MWSGLAGAKIGIICLTPENTKAPWLLFEAGAISKIVSQTYLCPYLLDLKEADVPEGPLTQFQFTVAEHEDTWKLVKTVNEALGHLRLETDLKRAFDKWWPDLERTIATIPPADTAKKINRKPENMIEEILSIVRGLSYNQRISSFNQPITRADLRRELRDADFRNRVMSGLMGSPAGIADASDGLNDSASPPDEEKQVSSRPLLPVNDSP